MSVKIIGEIGINHNGDLELCKKLIDSAVLAGCDYVKFQKRNPDVCVPEEQKSKQKSTPWGEMTYLEYKYKVEFGKEEYDEIDRYCKEKGIGWFASVWDKDSVDFIGWYIHKTNKILRISKKDPYRQYLAYYKGWGDYKNYSKDKKAIIYAKSVKDMANKYRKQLTLCKKNLDKNKYIIF